VEGEKESERRRVKRGIKLRAHGYGYGIWMEV